MLVVTMLAGCDTDGDYVETGYQTIQVSFVYPQTANQQYDIMLDGQTAKNNVIYVPSTNHNGVLEVKDKATGEIAFSDNVEIKPNLTIPLILLDGEVGIFSEENYAEYELVFIPLIAGEESLYTLKINGNTVIPYTKSYARKGIDYTLEISKDGTPLYTGTINIESGTLCIIEQQSPETGEMSYLTLTGSADEAEPDSEYKTKVRFFFNKVNDLADVDSVNVDFYSFNQETYQYDGQGLEKYKSVKVKVGELSDYVEFDLSLYKDISSMATGFMYHVTNANDGSVVFDLSNQGQLVLEPQDYTGDAVYKSLYKFQTAILDGSYGWLSIYTVFGERWHPTTNE